MTPHSHFRELLKAASTQPQPQRLLFVFARADLPDKPTAQQRERFMAGQGGTLTPLMCVDKAPAEVMDFEALLAESRLAGPPWQVVFAAGLSGAEGSPPTPDQIGLALEKMVNAVWTGSIGPFAAYDPAGHPITFS